ncbi:uncharacterized protein C1orf43 homolog isoform X1 [Parus major]|uniref:uncharacterized protein C1orf43 homolog isoform X1 n=1 Tax=Parus major TaxID=9157 RepID=UPI0007716206|nr:uncharacterized protein C1orf43 homolog isoform X1 [Parus major]
MSVRPGVSAEPDHASPWSPREADPGASVELPCVRARGVDRVPERHVPDYLGNTSVSGSRPSWGWAGGSWGRGEDVFVLLFIFVKRQIMRFAMKSRRGPHVPVGQHAPKDLKEEIDIRLSRVQDIKYEPQLLAEDDGRLLQLETPGCYNYLYRMKALDAIRTSEIPFQAEGRYPKSLIGKNFCAYLLELRNSSTSFKGIRKALIDTLLDGYESARYGTGVFGKMEYLKYEEALNELANMTKTRGGSSQRQHQSAVKDLTLSPEVSSPTTIQVTYLPSSQKSKRAKHFLELKSFKDNYNTLESTL